jgi:hypothetical protein
MKSRLAWNWQFTIALVMATVSTDQCCGTDRYFPNREATSPNGRYHLTAKSPDNASTPDHVRAFQAGFVYVLRDTKAGKDLWTRKQPEDKPSVMQADGKPFVLRRWKEYSPVGVHVQDQGWSVLWLGGDDLVAVHRDGKETGRVNILCDALSKEERKHHVHDTTAGPWWGLRHSYFTSHQGKSYFVVRTWWGHRAILDLESGRLASDTGTLAKHLEETDRAFVRNTLKAAAKDYQKWAKCCNELWAVRMAIYMAGQMHMKECVPSLRSLEDVPYSGSSTSAPGDEPKEGELDTRYWDSFEVRQVVQLSLRRLGEVPRCFPATQFDLYAKEYDRRKPFVPVLGRPRAQQAGALRKGMKPIEVLRLIGAPDFVEETWQYDMDEQKPYTLLVEWGETGVKSVQRKSPAFWQGGDCRDQQIMMR